MSSLPPPATASKASTPSQSASPQPQPSSAVSGDSYGQRRTGGSGSFGAGASSRSHTTSRNSQASKKQHKGSKRFKPLDEDALVETTAMSSINSRKGRTSITHLMNFSLPPRPQNHFHSQGSTRNYRRNPTWGLGSGYHAVDKARYINANYRFIVDPRGDYRPQGVDPDVPLDWKDVLQILVSSQSQLSSCPICLGTPVAPRMARCGHIFCLPCLMRYMSTEDESKPVNERRARWKSCPLCWDHIYVVETRPVRWYAGQEGMAPREGGDVVLRLVMRPAGSTLSLPRDDANALDKDEDIPWHNAAEVMDYARVIRGSEEYMLAQYEEDIVQLDAQEKEDELMFGEDNIEWMRKAIRMTREAKEKVRGIGNPPALPKKPLDAKLKRPPIAYSEPSLSEAPDLYSVQHGVKSGQSLASTSTSGQQESTMGSNNADPSSHPSHSNPTNTTPHNNHPPSEYYFYQALLHYYLSPLDIRILKAAFGNFSSFPSTILPRVERVSTGHVVDDELRKRTKYLAHIPYGCEVGFLECDWTDTVPSEVLEKFKPEIEKRRKRNEDKESREEKARQRAEKEEESRYAAHRRRRSVTSSDVLSAEDFQPLAIAEAVDEESMSASPPWPARRDKDSTFASLASPSSSPSAVRTVWGTTAVASTSPILRGEPQIPEGDDGWLQGWEKDLLHDDELLAEATALSLAGESSQKPAAGNKKKKGKKITLMTTNARRGA